MPGDEPAEMARICIGPHRLPAALHDGPHDRSDRRHRLVRGCRSVVQKQIVCSTILDELLCDPELLEGTGLRSLGPGRRTYSIAKNGDDQLRRLEIDVALVEWPIE